MKLIITLFLCLILKAEFLYANTASPCVADVSQYTQKGLEKRVSIFLKESKSVAKVFDSKLLTYGFEDNALLKNKVKVKFTVGGCAHYGYSFEFSGPAIHKIENSKKIKRAKALLSKIETTDNTFKDQLLGAITKAVDSKKLDWSKEGLLILPCGDAYCELVDSGDQVIKISYSFAL